VSYILEALRRAERERQAGQIGESAAGGGQTPQAPRIRPTTMALAGLTLFLAGVGLAALMLRPPGPVPAASVPTQQAAPQPATVPEPAMAAAVPPASTPAARLAERELPASDAGSLDDITPVFQGTPALVTPASPAEAPSRLAPDPDPQLAPLAAATPSPATRAPPRPPTLRELPAELRARFPELVLQVHVHNAEPGRRWIMVANRRHGEGAVLDGGVRVIEIVADGVIFELDGTQLFWPLAR
jgi:general secretion pathway protein B